MYIYMYMHAFLQPYSCAVCVLPPPPPNGIPSFHHHRGEGLSTIPVEFLYIPFNNPLQFFYHAIIIPQNCVMIPLYFYVTSSIILVLTLVHFHYNSIVILLYVYYTYIMILHVRYGFISGLALVHWILVSGVSFSTFWLCAFFMLVQL